MLKRLSREKNILIVMISHDINIAAKYSDKIILMHKGSVFDMGEPNKVITAENLRTVYGVTAEITKDDDAPHVILKAALPMDEEEDDARIEDIHTLESKNAETQS